VGKILGPLSLALIAGTGNIVSPHATADAVLPAFMFLSFATVLVGLSFTVLGVETHGIPIAQHGPAGDDAAERPMIVQ
jgi:MFS transporter, putative metabolite:H+ symporter